MDGFRSLCSANKNVRATIAPTNKKGLCMALNSRCDIPGEINAISVKISINSMSWFDIPIASECHRYDFSKRYKLQREGRFFRPSIKYLKLMESINTQGYRQSSITFTLSDLAAQNYLFRG